MPTPKKNASKQTGAKAESTKPGKSSGRSVVSRSVKSEIRSSKVEQLSALDAAAKVLAEVTCPMTTGEMIEAMSKKGYWTTPGGKTPAATLYSAILRELKAKDKGARFAKADRGKFRLA